MQLLCNQYFEVLVDHKAIEYMVKSKTETLTTRIKTLLHYKFKVPKRFRNAYKQHSKQTTQFDQYTGQ